LFGVVVVTGVRHRSRVTALFVFSTFPRKDFPNRMSFSRNHLMEWIKRRLTVRVVSVRVCVSPIGPEVFNSFVIHKRKREKKKISFRDHEPNDRDHIIVHLDSTHLFFLFFSSFLFFF
jgi:hypothetical protein